MRPDSYYFELLHLLIPLFLHSLIYNAMSDNNNQFGSKLGLIAATVGSAVGLGNIWRFPAEAQSNGGAAFLLIYIICLVILGIPVMLAEFSLGRAGRSDAFGTFKKLAPKTHWYLIGVFGIIGSYLIGIFYMVVEGWSLEYLVTSITGSLYEGVGTVTPGSNVTAADNAFIAKMNEYISTPWMPMVFTWIVIIMNLVILLGGVQKGIERLSNMLMPSLFVALLVLCCVALSLPGAMDGLVWFLKPDFSKITGATIINAMGQTFFSLSLGMGILVTYAAYYPDKTNMPQTAVIVSASSLLVALLVGFIIFPAVSSFGLADHKLEGTTLVFQTLPVVFACLPLTQLWSALFFLLLFFAALTSTVSIMEVSIAFLQDKMKMGRKKAVCVSMLPLLVFSAICSLSFSTLADFKIFGMTIFDLLDSVTTNILLPIGAILLCLFAGWVAPRHLMHNQLTNNNTLRSWVVTPVIFILRYIAPVLIAIILFA